MSAIERIGKPLRDLIRERGIIARCELLNRTYHIVRQADLTKADVDELEKLVGKQLPAGIFNNLLSGAPIFLDLPRLDTYTLIKNRIFHFGHTEKYSKEDFDNAFRKFLASVPELKEILYKNMSAVLTGFMIDAGYSEIDKSGHKIIFEAQGRKANCTIYTSMKSLHVEDFQPVPDEDNIILVPSGENLQLFVQFFKERGTVVEETKVQIWVLNLEQGTIDPFMGYTTDMDIYRQFKNPRLAEIVRTTWVSNAPVQ
jgi:hypothetical protein